MMTSYQQMLCDLHRHMSSARLSLADLSRSLHDIVDRVPKRLDHRGPRELSVDPARLVTDTSRGSSRESDIARRIRMTLSLDLYGAPPSSAMAREITSAHTGLTESIALARFAHAARAAVILHARGGESLTEDQCQRIISRAGEVRAFCLRWRRAYKRHVEQASYDRFNDDTWGWS